MLLDNVYINLYFRVINFIGVVLFILIILGGQSRVRLPWLILCTVGRCVYIRSLYFHTFHRERSVVTLQHLPPIIYEGDLVAAEYMPKSKNSWLCCYCSSFLY